MSGPTREELAKRLGEVLATLAVLQPAEGSTTYLAQAERNLETCRLASDALLCADPLPPEGGERERKAQWLEGFGVEPQPRDYTRQMFSAEVRAEFRATTALLRQPPAAGVSTEALLAAIPPAFYDENGRCTACFAAEGFAHDDDCPATRLLTAIEALPEAAPRAGTLAPPPARWTGPLAGDLRPDGVTLARPVPPERWPYGPPDEHQDCCILRRGGSFCDCTASAAEEESPEAAVAPPSGVAGAAQKGDSWKPPGRDIP